MKHPNRDTAETWHGS